LTSRLAAITIARKYTGVAKKYFHDQNDTSPGADQSGTRLLPETPTSVVVVRLLRRTRPPIERNGQ
jgi:hypothetical protein